MLRTHVRATLIAAVTATGAIALPAAAEAATVTPGAACFIKDGVNVQPITAAVGGLGAGQAFRLQLSRKGEAAGSISGTADAAGNASVTLGSWFLSLGTGPKKEVTAQLDAIDPTTGASLGAAPVSIASAGVSVTGTGKNRSWKVQGLKALTGVGSYYAHYLNNGKYRGRLKLGTGKGNCGYLKTRKPLTPFSRLGRYDVQIQSAKEFQDGAPALKGRIVVTRRYR